MPERLMYILFDNGTPRPLRRRLFGHDVETSVAGFRGRARGSAGGWRPGPLFFAGRGPPALGSGRAVIRAWHFKAGAVNVFSGLRAPAAPSLTVNTAFVDPDRCHLFPPAWVPSLAPCCVLVGPVFPWPGVGPGGPRPSRVLARRRGFLRCPAPVAGAPRLRGWAGHPAGRRSGHPRCLAGPGISCLVVWTAGPAAMWSGPDVRSAYRRDAGCVQGFRRCGRRPTGRPAWP